MAFRKPAARQQVDTAAIAEAVASAVRSHLETEVPGFGALPEAQQEWLYISVIRFCRRFHVKPEKDKIGAYLDEAFRIELDDGELFNVVVPRLRNGWAKYVALCGKKNEGVVHVERYPPLEEVSSSPIAMDDMHPHHDQGDSVADAPWLDHGHEDDDVMSPGRGTKRVSSEQRQSAHSKVAKASDQSDSDFEDSESGQQRAVAGPSSGAGKASSSAINSMFASWAVDGSVNRGQQQGNAGDRVKPRQRRAEVAMSKDPWGGLDIPESLDEPEEAVVLCPASIAIESVCVAFCRNYLREHKVALRDAEAEWKHYAELISQASKAPGSEHSFSVSSASDALWDILRDWKAPMPRRRNQTRTNFYSQDISQAIAPTDFPAKHTRRMVRLPAKTFVLYRLVLSGYEKEEDILNRHDELSGETFTTLSVFVEQMRREMIALGIHRKSGKAVRNYSATQVSRALKELEKTRSEETEAGTGADETLGFRAALTEDLPVWEVELAKLVCKLLTEFYAAKKKPSTTTPKKSKTSSAAAAAAASSSSGVKTSSTDGVRVSDGANDSGDDGGDDGMDDAGDNAGDNAGGDHSGNDGMDDGGPDGGDDDGAAASTASSTVAAARADVEIDCEDDAAADDNGDVVVAVSDDGENVGDRSPNDETSEEPIANDTTEANDADDVSLEADASEGLQGLSVTSAASAQAQVVPANEDQSKQADCVAMEVDDDDQPSADAAEGDVGQQEATEATTSDGDAECRDQENDSDSSRDGAALVEAAAAAVAEKASDEPEPTATSAVETDPSPATSTAAAVSGPSDSSSDNVAPPTVADTGATTTDEAVTAQSKPIPFVAVKINIDTEDDDSDFEIEKESSEVAASGSDNDNDDSGDDSGDEENPSSSPPASHEKVSAVPVESVPAE